MVPVLSRRRTSTSPAASNARPDMAMTFFWIMRSIPAIPIADSRAPIVVGMRQTSRATRTVTVTGFPCPACCTLYEEKGNSVAVASQKDVERDLVGRLLPLRPFDQGDHPVEERPAGIGGHIHDERVREDLG